jgi:hypothetical protein
MPNHEFFLYLFFYPCQFSVFTIEYLLSNVSEESLDITRDSSGSEGYSRECSDDFQPDLLSISRSPHSSSISRATSRSPRDSLSDRDSPFRRSSSELSDNSTKISKIQKSNDAAKLKGLLIFKLTQLKIMAMPMLFGTDIVAGFAIA